MTHLSEIVTWHITYCLAMDLLFQAAQGFFDMPNIKLVYRVKGYAGWVLLVLLQNV